MAPEAGEWEVFIFISARHVLCFSLPGWERRAPPGDAPLCMGVGSRTTESLFAQANLATPQLQLRCPRVARLCEGTLAGTEPCPSWGLESFPEATPRPRPWGMLFGAAGASRGGAAGGWTGLGSVEGLNLPRAQALWGGQPGGRRGRPGSHSSGLQGSGLQDGGTGKFIHRVTFQAVVMSARNGTETPLSGCSFALFVSLPEVPHLGLAWAGRWLGDLTPEAGFG